MEAKSDLRQLYELLKEDFPLKLTNALAVDDGFTDDFPLLYGKYSKQDFWLYDYCDEWVFSYGVTEASTRGHTHPQSIEEAEEYIREFMSGKWDASSN